MTVAEAGEMFVVAFVGTRKMMRVSAAGVVDTEYTGGKASDLGVAHTQSLSGWKTCIVMHMCAAYMGQFVARVGEELLKHVCHMFVIPVTLPIPLVCH